MLNRVFVLILDSFGVGASHDAELYGDQGANTLGHIADYCKRTRGKPLQLPNLQRLGLAHVAHMSCGRELPGLSLDVTPQGCFGYAVEQSRGKDTPSGHWEIAGVPVFQEWGYFREKTLSMPSSLINTLIDTTKINGLLGNKQASGTEIIDELGAEHIKTAKPIIYTSGDSVIQIAAHEISFGLARLLEVCQAARIIADEYNIARVIARPFIGEAGNFTRTTNRKDFSTPPPEKTLLDHLVAAGREVISIGKIADIFAHRGITQKTPSGHNNELFDDTLTAIDQAPAASLCMTNFVDFDSRYGHRRDIAGYANALEVFDQDLPRLIAKLRPHDLVIISADHGCDPSFPGSDHTREHVPILAFGPQISAQNIGRRESFSDIGQTIANYLGIAPLPHGSSFSVNV